MGRYLLGANSFEEGLHVVEVREHNWVLLGVVGVNVPLFHFFQVGLVVALAVFTLVNGLLAIRGS